jgi:hypothetical protein
VVDRVCGGEQNRVVTVFAQIAGQNMIEAFACRIGTVMATEAIARDTGVIKIRRQPGH